MHIKLKHFLKIVAVSLVIIGTPVIHTNATYAVDTTNWATQSKCTGNEKVCVCPSDKPVTGCGKDSTTTDAPYMDCGGPLDGAGKPIPDRGCTLFTKYLNPFIKLLSTIAGVSVVIGIIYGGIIYSMSGGDPQKTAKSKRVIRNSIVALLVYLFLGAMLKFLIPGTGLLIG